ncbi:MAG: hypothetical protein RLZZ299_143 [Pseudomonadota bacterium]
MRPLVALLLFLWHVAWGAPASPSWRSAPEPPPDTVAAPSGGWWVEDGLWARVYASEDDRELARNLADHAATAVPRLAAALGVPAGRALSIYVAPTAEDFARMQPGLPPEWADGTAWPSRGWIFLRAPSARPVDTTPLTTVLDHEIVHVLLGHAFRDGAGGPPVPRWLQEGLARLYAGELGPDTAHTLLERAGLPSLASITRTFPQDALDARIAYAAATDFLGRLRQDHGESSLRTLIRAMAEGRAAPDALRLATGEELATLEARWRADWAAPLAWHRALEWAEALGWPTLAGLLAFGWVRKARRTRRTLARWEREEALADALAAIAAERRAAEEARPGPFLPLPGASTG